mmetsp:Transcript_18443/g.50355  ORF Transcript_18443/g.50355 Transcript_18443/m.50355 type:complete len:572 (+) Transcript_18443:59-1774(+)
MTLSRRVKKKMAPTIHTPKVESTNYQAKRIEKGLTSLVVLATVFYLHMSKSVFQGVAFFGGDVGNGGKVGELFRRPVRKARTPPSTRCPVDHCLSLGSTPQEQYPNLVRLDGGGKSGLFDRIGIVNHLANIAAMFCARLEIPPPHIILARFHNRGQRIDKNLTWQDFVSYEFLTPNHTLKGVNDGKSFPRVVWDILLPEGESTTATLESSSGARTVHIFNHTGDESGENDYYKMWKLVQLQKEQRRSASRPSFVYNMNPQHGWRFLRDIVERRQVKGMMEMDDITDNEVIPSFQVNRHKPCGHYVQYQFPTLLINLAELVLQEAAMQSPPRDQKRIRKIAQADDLLWFGFLHLRRGDIAKNCDTSLEKMKSYFQCSFAGQQTAKFMKQRVEHQKRQVQAVGSNQDDDDMPFMIFLATDETDRKYRKDMLKMIEHTHEEEATVDSGNGKKETRIFKPVRALDIDRLIMEVLKQEIERGNVPERYENNQSVFLIGRIIAQLAVFTLEQRKDLDCDGCNLDKVEPAFAQYNSLTSQDGDEHFFKIREFQQEKWNHLIFYDKTQLLNNSTNHQIH